MIEIHGLMLLALLLFVFGAGWMVSRLQARTKHSDVRGAQLPFWP